MTCNGCRSFVEKTLSGLEQTTHVEVSLEREEAVIASDHKLDMAILRELLPSKYFLQELSPLEKGDKKDLPVHTKDVQVSKWRQLKPLFLILGYIATASALLHRELWDWREVMMDFMGLFFIVFSFFKLIDLKGFVQSFAMYDPFAAQVKIYAWVYPFIEVILGVMILLRWQVPAAMILTIIVLGITSIGVARTLLRKDQIQCACLGTALKLPMTEATIIENAIMLLMAFSMLFLF